MDRNITTIPFGARMIVFKSRTKPATDLFKNYDPIVLVLSKLNFPLFWKGEIDVKEGATIGDDMLKKNDLVHTSE